MMDIAHLGSDTLGFLIKAVSFIVVIGVLIFIHEFGHFIVARIFGMGVRAFSLGFGKRLVGVTVGRTEYRVSAFPLGGYVQLVAQDSEDDEAAADFPESSWFIRRPAWQRMLVVAAGPVFNLLLAWGLYTAMFSANGLLESPAAVGQVTPASAAEAAGLKPGDAIVRVNNAPIRYFSDLKNLVEKSRGEPLTLEITRDGKPLSIQATPTPVTAKNIFGETVAEFRLGVVGPKEAIHVAQNPWQAMASGLRQTWEMVALTGTSFWKLVMGVVPMSSIGGPIMIAELVGQQSAQGLASLIMLTAMISVNLAILNLLPIPILDGGHILFFALETIFRRPVPEKVRTVTTKIGFGLLVALMLLATGNDVNRLIRGG